MKIIGYIILAIIGLFILMFLMSVFVYFFKKVFENIVDWLEERF